MVGYHVEIVFNPFVETEGVLFWCEQYCRVDVFDWISFASNLCQIRFL